MFKLRSRIVSMLLQQQKLSQVMLERARVIHRAMNYTKMPYRLDGIREKAQAAVPRNSEKLFNPNPALSRWTANPRT